MFVKYQPIAETPKMFIGKIKSVPGSVQLGLKEPAGGSALISLGNAKKVSNKMVEYINGVLSQSKLSPEEKSLMLKAIYK